MISSDGGVGVPRPEDGREEGRRSAALGRQEDGRGEAEEVEKKT